MSGCKPAGIFDCGGQVDECTRRVNDVEHDIDEVKAMGEDAHARLETLNHADCSGGDRRAEYRPAECSILKGEY